MRKAAFDRAETGNYVVARLEVFRRLARVLVDERLDIHPRPPPLHFFGHLVDEGQERPRMGLLAIVDRLAVRACAVVRPVALRDAHDIDTGILHDTLVRRDMRKDVRYHDLQHVGIRETKLRALCTPHTVHLAEILRVAVEPDGRRHQPPERVAAAQPVHESVGRTPVFGLRFHVAAVHAVAHGEIG